ncbi:MAG: DUF262 and DUF1524 domain-containing protein [Parvularculales bacterium]
MDAKHTNLLNFIGGSFQFLIPIYQRKYSWDRVQCEQLWNDIIRAGKGDSIESHFIGSIVYVADTDAHNAPLLVIDGQQRLTTLTLLISALSYALGEQEPYNGFSQKKLKGYYLINEPETGNMRRKLVLSETDRDTLFAVIDGQDTRDLPENYSHRIKDNFLFFEERIKEYANDLESVCRGLSKLLVVYVALSRKGDNPQLIFESMNSTGRELSQADLIRNFVLMGLDTGLQERLYNQYWRSMEQAFGQEAYDKHFDKFMRYFLIVKTGNMPRLDDVYTAFKDYARPEEIDTQRIEELVKDICQYSRYFCAMALDKESDPDLKAAFNDLRELRVDVAYPLLLVLYADFKSEVLEHDDFLEAVRLVETYVFRRAVCEIPTNSMNKTFATFAKALKKDCYLESIIAHFLLMPSYRRFPSDEEFREKIKLRNLYNFPRRSYWLRRFENFGRKERVPVGEYTIEHIMPQSLTKEWKTVLGEDWQQIHERYLHTLGNLTLTGYNSEYSDRPFVEKRDMKGGFRHSPLKVNSGLGELDEWTDKTIINRANSLAEKAINVWRFPYISEDILETYRPKEVSPSTYSFEDHRHLTSSPTKQLFESLQREILNLDPCVSEEILKHYIAYKAETNFVDVIPQAKGLQLILNMEFMDISDPKRLCRNITGLGRWGNGDVEVKYSGLDELPYILSLVRQSLERQLGNGGDE